MPAKKTANISTVRATPEEKIKLEETVRRLGFRSIAHFFTRSMETLLAQHDAGEDFIWPLRFETKKEAFEKKTSSKKPRPRKPYIS